MRESVDNRAAAADAFTHVPSSAGEWAFFLDVDGTLLDFAERPDAVRVSGDLGELLARLQEACGGALALISGRTVADIDRLFAPRHFVAAGQHGIERRDARGSIHRQAFPGAPLQRTAQWLRTLAERHPGLLVEEKERSVALHYRRAPDLGEIARRAVLDAVARLGRSFEMLSGKFVYEVRPGGRDKGIAIEEYMAEAPFASRIPVFVGDDATDEYGFATANRLGGHSVKVGAGPSVAQWRLADAAAVRAWLAACVTALAGASD